MIKFLQIFAISILLPFSAISGAQQSPNRPPPEGGKGMGPGMGGMENMDQAGMTDHLKRMQDEMLKMHELSNNILAETNPAKKQALKNQQLELMKEHHMRMMSRHRDKQDQQHDGMH